MGHLSKKAKNLLTKAKDSALTAIEIYNKPNISFRSGSYITLMCIAWTSLLHAIFELKNIKYFYKKSSRRYEYIEGEKKAWDLKKSVAHYLDNSEDPIRKNLEFFIGLRNKIEHRFMPELDNNIYGECQSLLINFEDILIKEFGEKNSISGNLVFALQFSRFNQKNRVKQDSRYKHQEVLDYIKNFRERLDERLWQDEKFSFRVFLIPKVSKTKSDSDIAVEFIKYDPSKPEEMAKYKHLVALVSEKEKIIQVANQGKYRPSDVVKEVSKRLGKKFSMDMHVKAYKKYKVRPPKNSSNPMECNSIYCQYDQVHRDYVYTEEWVNFLVKELSKDENYNALISYNPLLV